MSRAESRIHVPSIMQVCGKADHGLTGPDASVRNGRGRIDFHQECRKRQAGHAKIGARRRSYIALKCLDLCCHHAKFFSIRSDDVSAQVENVLRTTAARSQNDVEVRQDLPGLRKKVAWTDQRRIFIEGDLPGDIKCSCCILHGGMGEAI